MSKIFVWIISIIIFAFLLVFALNNLENVAIKFAGGMQWEAPLIVLVLIVFAMGCFTGMFAMLPFAWRRHRQGKKAAQQAAANAQAAQTGHANTNAVTVSQ